MSLFAIVFGRAQPRRDEKPAPLPCAISGTGEGSGGGRSESGRTHIREGERALVIQRLLAPLAVLAMLPAPAVFAHSFDPALLDIRERDPGVFEARWTLPLGEAGAPRDRSQPQLHLPPHCRRLADAAPERFDCGATGLRGHTISLHAPDGTRLDVVVRITWRDGDAAYGVLHAAMPEFLVPGAAAVSGTSRRVGDVFWSYFRLGTEHILFGFDHLLFVLGLMLLVATWRALLATISAFTLAHSVTLTLAVVGVVEVSPAPIEVLIALSIVLLASELARPAAAPPTLTRRYPWLVAFAFGLLHGLGFAGALAEIGLPPGRIPLALVSFNVGVEAGQLVFVTLALAPLTLLRRPTLAPAAAQLLPAYAMGSVAVAWTIERVQRFW